MFRVIFCFTVQVIDAESFKKIAHGRLKKQIRYSSKHWYHLSKVDMFNKFKEPSCLCVKSLTSDCH